MGSKRFSLAKIDKALTSKTADPVACGLRVWADGGTAENDYSGWGNERMNGWVQMVGGGDGRFLGSVWGDGGK